MAYLEILQKHNADLGGLIEKANSLPEKGDLGKQLDALIEGSITEVVSGATTVIQYKFYYHSKIKSAKFPNATSVGTKAFYGCSALKIVELDSVTNIGSDAFYRCSALESVILRSKTLCTLASYDAFSMSSIAYKTGYFYVPRALVASYQSATNWSTFSTQFRALEDYTVDGTTTGALDPNKI